MKRFIKLIFVIFLFTLLKVNVKAVEAVCRYSFNSNKSEITVNFTNDRVFSTLVNTGTGIFDMKFSIKNEYIEKADFYRGTEIKCPTILYYEWLTKESENSPTNLINISAKKENAMYAGSAVLVDEKISNNAEGEEGESPSIIGVPSNCTPTGKKSDVCKSNEVYDASRNLCKQGGIIEYTNRIRNNGGYDDYFLDDWDDIYPSNGQCLKGYVLGKNSNGETTCKKKVCYDGYRLGDTCIQCKELASSSGGGNNLGPDAGPNLPPANVPTCGAIKEFTDPIWFWLRIIGPTLALVLGVLDLLKAVASGDDKSVKKSTSDFGMRLGLAAALLLLPTLLDLIIGLVGFGDIGACRIR